MPRYCYKCNKCETVITVMHLSTEELIDCPKCTTPGALNKLLTTFRTNTPILKTTKIGQVTEDFIVDSRQDLKLQKKKMEEDR